MTTFDPFDAEQSHDAWEVLAELRAAGAVVTIANEMRYVTRHAQCREALRDTASFSNASGMKAPGVEVPLEDRILGELDPPRHTAVRRVMVSALTPKVVHAAEPFMADLARQLFEAIAARRSADLVPAFTVPYPNRVTVHLLGLPPQDADQLAAWAKELMESSFPATNRTERGEGFAAAFPEFAGYIDDQIAQRSADPGDDIVSRLATLDAQGERLPLRTRRALVRNLITGGLTTTSQLLGNCLHRLLADPDLHAALLADPELVPVLVEESLRTSPPILFVARGCVHATEVGGTQIPQGSRLVAGIASANRDERVFDDPDHFDVTRPNAAMHLSFGDGPHVCPGATLARVESVIGLRTFLDVFAPGSIRLAEDFEFENVPTFFEIGPRSLPVTIDVG